MTTPARKPRSAKGTGPDAAAPATPRRTGRPSTFSEPVYAEILRRIEAGETLRAICESDLDWFPPRSTIAGWITADAPPGVAARFTRACEVGAEALLDEALAIADDGSNDMQMTERGNLKVNNEVVQRSKLRIDTRLRLLAMRYPERYGERLRVDANVEVAVRNASDEVLEKRTAALLAKAAGAGQVEEG